MRSTSLHHAFLEFSAESGFFSRSFGARSESALGPSEFAFDGLLVSQRDGMSEPDEEVRVVVVLENHGDEAVPLIEVTDAFGPAHADRQR